MIYMETDKIELKEKINETLCKEIESFLNTNGGCIYIGVRDDGTVVGVDSVDEVLRKISDIITDQIEPSAIDCVSPEVIYESNKILIKIVVKKGYDSLYCIKKYGFSSNGCHIRVGTTCKSMPLDTIRNRIEERSLNYDLMVKIPSYYDSFSFTKLKLLSMENGYHVEDNSFERNFKLRNLDGKYNFFAEIIADKTIFRLSLQSLKEQQSLHFLSVAIMVINALF